MCSSDLSDPSVSGRHAEVRRDGEIWRIKDLQSTNGTRVNGDTIDEVALRLGDRLRFGKVEAHFEADTDAGSEPLPQPAAIEAKPAQSSTRPADFTNASPFPVRKAARDPVRLAILAGALVALLAFLASMIAVLTMQAPV